MPVIALGPPWKQNLSGTQEMSIIVKKRTDDMFYVYDYVICVTAEFMRYQ